MWTTLTHFLRVSRKASTDRKRAYPGRHVRLCLEGLETRDTPSTVTTLADSGPGSLRDAIASTPAGGSIDFQSGLGGTINLTSGELVVDHSLSITGPGADSLTINGGNLSRVFDLTLSTSRVAISGLTIAGGYATPGNSTGFGGGIENRGTLSLSGCTLSGNYAQYGGGGIENWVALTVSNCIFTSNSNDPRLC